MRDDFETDGRRAQETLPKTSKNITGFPLKSLRGPYNIHSSREADTAKPEFIAFCALRSGKLCCMP
jgi:hypothetical protein